MSSFEASLLSAEPVTGSNFSFHVVIACAGDSEGLGATLQSLNKCAKPAGFSGVILVENGRKRNAESVCTDLALRSLQIQYCYLPPKGKSRALNHALTRVSGNSLLFFSDDDVEFASDCLQQYCQAARSYGVGHYFGGPVGRCTGAPVPPDFLLNLAPRSVTGWSPDPGAENRLFLGCNWACFKSDLEKAGGFDENFGPGAWSGAVGQETRMQIVLYRLGVMPIFVANAIVAHCPKEESMRMRWLFSRRYREGIHKGMLPAGERFKEPNTYFPNEKVSVLEPASLDGNLQIFRFFLTRLMVQAAEVAGIIKGWFLRLFLHP